MKKILLVSNHPIGHTGYGNQTLNLYNYLKKYFDFVFLPVDIDLSYLSRQSDNVSDSENVLEKTTTIEMLKITNTYNNLIHNKPEYLMDNIPIYIFKNSRKNIIPSDYWKSFEQISKLENIDLILTICDVQVFNLKPINLNLPKIISWLPIHFDILDLQTKLILPNLNYIISTSMWGMHSLKTICKDNVNYIPHNIDNEFYQLKNSNRKNHIRNKLGIPKNYFVVLLVGRNTEPENRKLFDVNINAFKLFKTKYKISNCWFHLHTNIKGGFDFENLLDFSCMSVSNQHQLFSYSFTKSDIHDLYNMADVLLCLSAMEGFGLPILEAQLAGLPVIATNSSAITENIYNGHLVKRSNIICNNICNNESNWFKPCIIDASEKLYNIYCRNDEEKLIKANITRDIIKNKFNENVIFDEFHQKINEVLNNKLTNETIEILIANSQEEFDNHKLNKTKYLLIINPNFNENGEKLDLQINSLRDNTLVINLTLDHKVYKQNYFKFKCIESSLIGIESLFNNKHIKDDDIILFLNTKIYVSEIRNNRYFFCFELFKNFNIRSKLGFEIFDNHLLHLNEIYNSKPLRKINKIENCNVNALLIDNRKSWKIEPILLNMINFTDIKVGFQIICENNNYNYLLSILQKYKLEDIIELTVVNYDLSKTSNFMFSREFFDNVKLESVLIYQLDSLLLKEFDNKFLNYDWIGSPWISVNIDRFNFGNKKFVGNGGFNLRNIYKCKKISEKFNFNYENITTKFCKDNLKLDTNIEIAEDILYSYYLQENQELFAFECISDNTFSNSMSFHNAQNYIFSFSEFKNFEIVLSKHLKLINQ
jgi:glycosyltransferase involved in cell wall biosynthesis